MTPLQIALDELFVYKKYTSHDAYEIHAVYFDHLEKLLLDMEKAVDPDKFDTQILLTKPKRK